MPDQGRTGSVCRQLVLIYGNHSAPSFPARDAIRTNPHGMLTLVYCRNCGLDPSPNSVSERFGEAATRAKFTQRLSCRLLKARRPRSPSHAHSRPRHGGPEGSEGRGYCRAAKCLLTQCGHRGRESVGGLVTQRRWEVCLLQRQSRKGTPREGRCIREDGEGGGASSPAMVSRRLQLIKFPRNKWGLH